jgi:exopolyphosphatase/guanosine-5'-triphosphate,3'-diphosphate pyrophosphatase
MKREGNGTLQLVGTGGTTTILARMEGQLEAYDRARIEATKLSLGRLQWHTRRLWGLPLEERKQIVGLPSNRTDVILMGVVIYQMIMENFGFKELRVSTRGLRFAAVLNS